jgi:hypothetical protein
MFCNTKPSTIVRERSCAGPTLVRYDLKEGAVAAGFDIGEKQDCERNAAMATLNQPGPPQEIDKVRFEIAGGDGFGIAEPRSRGLDGDRDLV